MKRILTTSIALLAGLMLFSQNSAAFWSESNRSDFARPAFMPQAWRALTLDMDGLRNHLRQAPMEFTDAATSSPLAVMLPMPDGSMEAFAIAESPIMEPALAERYPMIKTYAGRGVEHPNYTVRISCTPQGFNAIVHTGHTTMLITPNTPEEQVYLSFWLKDIDFNTPEAQQFHCEVNHSSEELEAFTENFVAPEARSATAVDLYTYRLAVATTKEYSEDEGNTQASVLAAVVTVVNNVNSVFERDAAVRLLLIANTDQVFFYGNPDPYSNGNTQNMIEQNPAVLNAAFGIDGYDIGHVFGTDGGGLASLGGVCNGSIIAQYPKASAASCKFGPYQGALFYIIAGHEMGHQFSATHTFNKCDNENETAITAYEPGSGSTIMCYNGNDVCTVNHVQPTSDPFFHINSMLRIQDFTRNGGGSQCKQVIAEGNEMPTSDITLAGGFSIPKSTPFSLTGVGSDVDDPTASLTYTWEQYDLGPPSTLGQPEGTAPLFRWYPPTSNTTRIFPRIETIVSNTSDIREVLPTIDRPLTFRFVVRDNRPNAGAFNFDEIQFNCTASAGPFLVTYPNTATSFTVGEYVEVTWDVANTNLAPVNCQKVAIYLSTDGGYTYPTQLIAQTANDGAAYVVMPNLPTTTARIQVKAADNIFFDISNENFAITAPTQPGYIVTATPSDDNLACDELAINIQTEALLGYDGQITLALSNPPAGITGTFSPNPIMAGQSSVLTLNTSNAAQTGNTTISVLATATGGLADQTRIVGLNVVDTDLSGIAAVSPADGASGLDVLPGFAWTDLANADAYEIQIAKDPGFADIIYSGPGQINGTYALSSQLEEDHIYYWRIKAFNACGEGEYGDPFSFHTVTQNCVAKSSSGDQNNIVIPSSGLPTILSKVNVSESGFISDVNVVNIEATHNSLRHLEIRLKGPDGTTAVLMSEPNCNSSNLNAGFDDQAVNGLVNCPSANEEYKPEGALSVFNGKNSQGDWTLELEVVNTAGDGGTFGNWDLEVCAGLAPNNPVVVKNDTLGVPPGATNRIYTDNLVANDLDNTWDELEFTIVTNTAFGTIELNGQDLGIGDHFTMYDVFNNYLTYTNTNAAAPYDYFTFNVNDGEGGFTGTPRFYLKMDADAGIIGSAEDSALAGGFNLFPNPANEEVNIVLEAQSGHLLNVDLLNIQGQIMGNRKLEAGSKGIVLQTKDLVAGLYFVQVKTSLGTFVKKLVIE